LRVLVFLESVLILFASTPGSIRGSVGETAAAVEHASVSEKTPLSVRPASYSVAEQKTTTSLIWQYTDSTFYFVATRDEHDQPWSKRVIDPSPAANGWKSTERFFPRNPGETSALAPREGGPWKLFPYQNDYLTIRFCRLKLPENTGPGGIIRFRDFAYVTVRKIVSPDGSTSRSLIRKDPPPATMFPLGTVFGVPAAQYEQISIPAELAPEMLEDLPAGQEFQFVLGAGYRQATNAHPSIPNATFETGLWTGSIAAQNGDNSSTRDVKRTDVVSIAHENSTIEIVISWFKGVALWLVTYGSRAPPFLPR